MSEQSTSRTLREILRTLFRRCPGIVLILAVVIVAVLLATSMAPRWYRSEAQLFAKPGRAINPLERPGFSGVHRTWGASGVTIMESWGLP